MAFEAYAYVISLIEKICNCANLYIGEVFASLSPEDLHDEQGHTWKPYFKIRMLLLCSGHICSSAWF